ncbi:hypothetical protein ASE63_23205 [Bosea sp. Root381]|uniref:four-carbon acid sugar kinase family protein n=1 Tax=Bosea sp. Root381 TaxID=1736524 RepID=UPI000700AEBD|nr:four-carbon acid sugar kinase family protein [Bosea sp. Root381]KRE07155.1 hypothetical protein ASE63_23205 [Bosea sp. Root381]
MLADDLTGALDSAAAFATPEQPVAVSWHGLPDLVGAVACDSASRELSAERARASVSAIAPALWQAFPGLAFKKIDSLLRGQEAAEITAILAILRPAHCIVAPAFPAQGRIARGGRQGVIAAEGWRPVPCDLVAELRGDGLDVVQAAPGAAIPPGVSFWDAETDDDLDAVVAAGRGQRNTLWVGSAGLAAALARAAGFARQAPTALPRPILGLVGSEHGAMRAQLARLGSLHHLLPMMGGEDAVAAGLARDEIAFVSIDLAAGMPRAEANRLIEARFAELLTRLDRPGTLFASGGETLRGLCDALGAERLDVTGEIVPGVPRSSMRGGRWDGITVISKSGAFGGPDLLKQLAAGDPAGLAGAAA